LAAARMINEGRFADLAREFNPQVAQGLPVARLEEIWRSVTAQTGPLRDIGAPREARQNGYTVVTVPLRFDHGTLDLILTYQQGKIAGLFIRPAEAPSQTWVPPAYDTPSAYRNLDVTVGAAPALPGTLSL